MYLWPNREGPSRWQDQERNGGKYAHLLQKRLLIHTYTHIYTYTYIYLNCPCIYICVDTYIYADIYIHACMFIRVSVSFFSLKMRILS